MLLSNSMSARSSVFESYHNEWAETYNKLRIPTSKEYDDLSGTSWEIYFEGKSFQGGYYDENGEYVTTGGRDIISYVKDPGESYQKYMHIDKETGITYGYEDYGTYYRTIYIMRELKDIVSPEEFEASQKLLIAEVYQKVTAGGNFEALIDEYNEDPGMQQQPDGYTFTKNSGMVKPFEDAAFALEIGEISEIVEQPQGWHILKKYPLLSEGEEYTQYISAVTNEMSTDIFNEYIDSLKANYTIEIEQGAVNGIKVK